jgi:hypothetical protein
MWQQPVLDFCEILHVLDANFYHRELAANETSRHMNAKSRMADHAAFVVI